MIFPGSNSGILSAASSRLTWQWTITTYHHYSSVNRLKCLGLNRLTTGYLYLCHWSNVTQQHRSLAFSPKTCPASARHSDDAMLRISQPLRHSSSHEPFMKNSTSCVDKISISAMLSMFFSAFLKQASIDLIGMQITILDCHRFPLRPRGITISQPSLTPALWHLVLLIQRLWRSRAHLLPENGASSASLMPEMGVSQNAKNG